MGNCVGGFKRGRRIIPWKRNKPMVICFIGLEGAGKTTIVKALQGENLYTVHSTVGFSRAEFNIKNQRLVVYDLGGNERIRDIWKNYYAEVFAVVFVFYASCEFQMVQSKEYLQEYQQYPELYGKPLLILLNKKDLPSPFDEVQFSNMCGLHSMAKKIGAGIRVELVCGIQGTGHMIDPCILDAFDWLIDQVLTKYDEIEKGVVTARVKLKERQAQERLKRQHRLAGISAARTDPVDFDTNAQALSVSETVDEKTETDKNKSSVNGTFAEVSNEIAKNETDDYKPEPLSRFQRILQYRKRTRVVPEQPPPVTDDPLSISMADLIPSDDLRQTDTTQEHKMEAHTSNSTQMAYQKFELTPFPFKNRQWASFEREETRSI